MRKFLGTILTLALALASSASLAVPRYSFTDLGPILDGGRGVTVHINDSGLIGGSAWLDYRSPQAFTFDRGKLTLLGAISVYAVGPSGQLVGYHRPKPEGPCYPCVWQDGAIHQLDGLPGSNGGEAVSADDSGRIYGVSYCEDAARACVWEDGVPRELAGFGSDWAVACRANSSGVVVGNANPPSGEGTHAVMWRDGSPVDLGVISGNYSTAVDINDLGQVVGSSDANEGQHERAFIWQDGLMTDLGTLGGLHSWANAINNCGQIVGGATTPTESYAAFVWVGGTMYDLRTLADDLSGWTLIDANDINNAGQIVGTGWLNGQARGFLLTPISTPEPGSIAALMLGCVGLVALRRRGPG